MTNQRLGTTSSTTQCGTGVEIAPACNETARSNAITQNRVLALIIARLDPSWRRSREIGRFLGSLFGARSVDVVTGYDEQEADDGLVGVVLAALREGLMDAQESVIDDRVVQIERTEADECRAGQRPYGQRYVGASFGLPVEAEADPRDDHHSDREQAVREDVRPEAVQGIIG